MVRCPTSAAVPLDAIVNQSSVYLCERSDAADVIPASMLGSLIAVITLDRSLAPFDRPSADHTGVLRAVGGARIDNSTGVTTEKEHEEDSVSVMSVCIVVVCFGVLYYSRPDCCVGDCVVIMGVWWVSYCQCLCMV